MVWVWALVFMHVLSFILFLVLTLFIASSSLSFCLLDFWRALVFSCLLKHWPIIWFQQLNFSTRPQYLSSDSIHAPSNRVLSRIGPYYFSVLPERSPSSWALLHFFLPDFMNITRSQGIWMVLSVVWTSDSLSAIFLRVIVVHFVVLCLCPSFCASFLAESIFFRFGIISVVLGYIVQPIRGHNRFSIA